MAIAGHNVDFDDSFMTVEFDRMGQKIPEIPRFCTLRLAGGGSLADCCDAYGVEFEGEAHEALTDPRAAACLLKSILTEDLDARERLATCRPIEWPKVSKTDISPRTRDAVRAHQPVIAPAVLRFDVFSAAISNGLLDAESCSIPMRAATAIEATTEAKNTGRHSHQGGPHRRKCNHCIPHQIACGEHN